MIVLAQMTDLGQILKITQEAINFMKTMKFYQWNEDYPNKEIFTQDIFNQHLYLYKENDEILGFICINQNFTPLQCNSINFTKEFDEKSLYLHRLAVGKNSQGKGVAQKLLYFCETLARQQNKSCLRADTLSLNIPMNKLFIKLGYKMVGNFQIEFYENDFFAYEKILA